MTTHTFSKTIHTRYKKHHANYKKLFELVEQEFPFLKKDIGDLYVEDNNNILQLLHILKTGNKVHFNITKYEEILRHIEKKLDLYPISKQTAGGSSDLTSIFKKLMPDTSSSPKNIYVYKEKDIQNKQQLNLYKELKQNFLKEIDTIKKDKRTLTTQEKKNYLDEIERLYLLIIKKRNDLQLIDNNFHTGVQRPYEIIKHLLGGKLQYPPTPSTIIKYLLDELSATTPAAATLAAIEAPATEPSLSMPGNPIIDKGLEDALKQLRDNKPEYFDQLIAFIKILVEEKIKITQELIERIIINGIDSLKDGLKSDPNKMNMIIAEFFEQFAENMPRWFFVQEYSKNFEHYKELRKLLKIENRYIADEEQLELRIAIGMAKLGSLFTPAVPGILNSPSEREQKFAAAALGSSGMVSQYFEKKVGGAEGVPGVSMGAVPGQQPAKTPQEMEKDAAKAYKDKIEMLSQTKKDANELSQILSQLQSEYKKSYSSEVDGSNDPAFDDSKDFLVPKQEDLRLIITNGDLTSDERSLVSKWASIKEENKWIEGLNGKITKAKELYDKVQKAIIQLANIPNDPQIAEMVKKIGLLNDGNIGDENQTKPKTIDYSKSSIPNNLSDILNEISSAYKLIVKAYSDSGESVTKRQTKQDAQNGNNNGTNYGNANQVSATAKEYRARVDKLTSIVTSNKGILDKNTQVYRDSKNKVDRSYTDTEYNRDGTNSSNFTSILDRLAKIKSDIKDKDGTADSLYTTLKTNIDTIEKEIDVIVKTTAPIPLVKPAATVIPPKDNSISNHIDTIKKIIDNDIIREIIKPLEMKLKTQLSPEYGVLNEVPTLLDDIYSKYQKSKVADGNLIASINLENLLNTHDLIPSEVLKITVFDKMIFAFVIVLFRLIAVTIVEYFIQKDWILSLANTIIATGVIYSILFIAFVLIVNFDLWRLRILFNYVNLHVNTSIIFTHLAMVWGFFGVVLLLVYNINFMMDGISNNITSQEDKAQLEYRLEMITAIIWLVILLLVVIF